MDLFEFHGIKFIYKTELEIATPLQYTFLTHGLALNGPSSGDNSNAYEAITVNEVTSVD